jgi:glycosyltransferase involved in cell wall biosynthesis
LENAYRQPNRLNQNKLLYVIDNLEFGGGERVFLQLAAGLKDRFQIFVAASSGGEFERRLRELEIDFSPVDMSRRFSLRPIRKIIDIIRAKEIDLLHSQGARADFFARVAGRTAGVQHIVCTVAMPAEGFEVGPFRKKLYRFMDSFTERYVDRFIVVSDSLQRTLVQDRKLAPRSVVRIYNGIELDNYQPEATENNLRTEWGFSQNADLIGGIGRMVWQKGFAYFIQAIPQILINLPQAKFVLVGEGPLRYELDRLAKKLDVQDKIIFPGFRSDIQKILSTIDVIVVPSLLEGFPMLTLEAMAMAKPIVATQINGITEQISDGREGILVPPKDPEALAAAVLRIVSDRELSSSLAEAARLKVEEYFSIQKMVGETEKVCLSLLQGNHSG